MKKPNTVTSAELFQDIAIESRNVNSTRKPTFTYPSKRNSVLAAVAADLLEDRRPSGKTCWLEHGSSRLSHHIWFLIHHCGWPVRHDDVRVHTSDNRVTTIAEYWLDRDVIDLQGERGKAFVQAVRHARSEQMRRAA